MKVGTLLELGRVSNLPTVWSNVLAGAIVGGGGAALGVGAFVLLGCAASSFYVGGMFLNDAFDAAIDARERPERPIPSGRARRAEVFAWGFGALALGLGLLVALRALFAPPSGLGLLAAGLFVVTAIVVYDRWHKGHAFSPVIMGACRAGLYAMAALAVAPALTPTLVACAAALLAYLVGLTHAARFENSSAIGRLWPTAFVLAPGAVALAVLFERGAPSGLAIALWLLPVAWAVRALLIALRGGSSRIRTAVGSLIAGISLVDAAFLAAVGAVLPAFFAVGAFALTLFAQRRIRGT
ncbi:MAG TPA: UbiA family prenyltransferase [Polyangiaceae bacterium]|nr:UbiA family prenyltransferase [Polyangiaceae bacterium]